MTKKAPFWKVGEPMIWLTGAALGIILMITVVLIGVIAYNGLGVFWPSDVARLKLQDQTMALGEEMKESLLPNSEERRVQLKVGNRDLYNLDFRWIDLQTVTEKDFPEDVVVLERLEYGNFYGFLQSVEGTNLDGGSASVWERFQLARDVVAEQQDLHEPMKDRIRTLANEMEALRKEKLKLEYYEVAPSDKNFRELLAEQSILEKHFEDLLTEQHNQEKALEEYQALFVDVNGRERMIALKEIVHAYRPNQMSVFEKTGFYGAKFIELLVDEPREANTEGGLFPAIFGTVMMVFIMSLFSFPLGVVTAVYLKEYAKDGIVVRTVRIAVNNLAGIPSIVYGVFGLGFFVYGVGGALDRVFFPESLPTPTFGTGGIFWASLTLALLTVPVVIVATEEALSSVPGAMREASLALGATQLQTLLRVVLPMASPGIMTGFILAMARAAGEVAPLMITGVVKLAPTLPVDGAFPYIHFERKFMHLGFHIFDMGFQSPNVEASKPMVFITTLLLVLIVLSMSSVAIYLRNQMRKRYAMKAF